MAAYKQRVEQFEKILFSDPDVDIKQFKKLCFDGIPDKPSIRSLSWKLLLHYLPPDKKEWDESLSKQRELYKHYLEEIVAHPDSANLKKNKQNDHPLNMNPDSEWITFFKDNEVLLQIDRDVRKKELHKTLTSKIRRLCPDISFFQRPTSYSIHHILDDPGPFETLTKRVEQCILESSVVATNKGGLKNENRGISQDVDVKNQVTIKKIRNEEYVVLPEGQEAHWQVVERILFIYAKLNPGISYVQGMNEIMGPLYYTFASDSNLKWQEHAEADSFFCFTNLMGEIRDNFIKTLDDSAHGIGQYMNKLLCLLQVKDGELWKDLETKQMKPQFFAFRWITLLLSQEFNLPDVIRLWDSLFSDPNRFDFLLYACCAMLILIRNEILESDFAITMKLIQNFPHETYDMVTIIRKAVELKQKSTIITCDDDIPPPSKSTTQQQVTGKSMSSRAQNLKARLVKFARNDSSS